MKRLLIVLITIVLVTAANMPVLAQDHEWWILEPNTWQWYTNALDPAKGLKIWVTPGDPGMANLHFDWYQNGTISVSDVLSMSKDISGDYWWHATNGITFKRFDNHDIPNPILIVDEPLEVGKAWTDTIYHPFFDIDLLYELECVAEIDVAVPNGIYHAFEIRYDVSYGANWSLHFVERKWHCDGDGLVKFVLEGYPIDPELDGEYELASTVDVGIPSAQQIDIHIHPNPFNPQTTISFTLGTRQHAEIAVYDLTSKRLAVLANQTFDAGAHSVVWNGKDSMGRAVPSGTYIVRLETESGVEARKVMLLR